MSEHTARIGLETGPYDTEVLQASVGNQGIDVRKLRPQTGYVTFDPGFANTAIAKSSITYIDGAAGQLLHRGYGIEDIAMNVSFLEVSYLLLYGKLPNVAELDAWNADISSHTMLNEEMRSFFDAFPRRAHPMAVLASATYAISTFYDVYRRPTRKQEIDAGARTLLAKMPTIAAWAYKKSIGEPYVYPNNDYSYVENFLHMMFSRPTEDLPIDPVIVKALNVLLILHADHEMNCSTATVRSVGSSRANMFASVAAGMGALWGPLHGGANQAVIEQLQAIHDDPDATIQSTIERAKDKNDEFRLMGFGHRVYTNYDPRAKVLAAFAQDVLDRMAMSDPLLDIARELEAAALADDYFVERKLFPNVDFYSGIIFRALGFPQRMFTVLFAIGRLPGWIAHWMEMNNDPDTRIMRPRQLYVGETARDYVPLDQR
ncbi:MAG: citrate (Si)-synthase [Actinobacteria bacterium]|nr:MAG: citrate (Si)-synthase [Actinomycetota bacterium]